MQTIEAGSSFDVHDGDAKVICSEKPVECTVRFALPPGVAGDSGCGKACANRCTGLQWLLVKWLRTPPVASKCFGADRPKVTSFSRLQRHQPPQRVEAGIKVRLVASVMAAFDESLTQSGIVIAEPVFEPDPAGFGGVGPTLEQAIGQVSSQLLQVAMAWEPPEKF